MRPITINKLNPVVQKFLYDQGFKPHDRADKAVMGSPLASENDSEAKALAAFAGVPAPTVVSWWRRNGDIQQERLELLSLDVRKLVQLQEA